MKRIYKLLLVLVIFLVCSGCSINYNLDIKESEITENIIVNDTAINGRVSSDILKDYQTWMPVYNNIENSDLISDSDGEGNLGKIDGIEYHEKTITTINNGYYLTYKYTYPIDKFNNANSIRLAYASPKVYNTSNYINIKTDDVNVLCRYAYFESLHVNITVDKNIYEVGQTNADKVNGDIYTWNLNRSNCDNSVISLTLNKKTNTSSSSSTSSSQSGPSNNKIVSLNNYVLYIFLGLIILIIILGYKWFNKMKNRENIVDD